MVIATELLSLNAHRTAKNITQRHSRTAARLASGKRINAAADDAAGLAISEKMRAQIRGLDQASRNAQDGISLIQTAEGSLSTINEMVLRMRELVVQAANDTNAHDPSNNAQSDRQQIQRELDQIMQEINAVAHRTEFNTRTLLDGSIARNNDFIGLAATAFSTLMAFSETPLESYNPLAYDLSENTILVHDRINNGWLPDSVGSVSEQAYLQGTINPTQNHVLATLEMRPGTAAVTIGIGLVTGVPIGTTPEKLLGLVLIAPDGTRFGLGGDFFGGADENTPPLTEFDLNTIIADIGDFFDVGIMNINLGNYPYNTQLVNHGRFSHTMTFGGIRSEAVGTWQIIAESHTTTPMDLDINILVTRHFNDPSDAFITPPIYPTPPPPPPPLRESGPIWLQLGANVGQGLFIGINAMHTEALGGQHGDLMDLINVLETCGVTISRQLIYLDNALAHVSGERAYLGAIQNRLEFNIHNLDVSSENLQTAKSRISDADMAREMMNFTMLTVIKNAALTMIAQANSRIDTVIQLLR